MTLAARILLVLAAAVLLAGLGAIIKARSMTRHGSYELIKASGDTFDAAIAAILIAGVLAAVAVGVA
jgi:hypothetical protein